MNPGQLLQRACRSFVALTLTLALFAQAATFAKGADVSCVDQRKAAGYSLYGADGLKQDPSVVNEVGMDWQQATTARRMLADLITKTKALDANGLGVFFREPQAYPGWQGYTLGALNGPGQFTVALDPF